MPTPFPYDRERHEAEVAKWRSSRLARLTAPESWLSLIGRVPLEQGTATVGADESCDIVLPREKAPSLAGRFERDDASVRFVAARGTEFTLRRGADVQPLVPEVAVTLRTDRDGAPDKLALGSLSMDVTFRESGMFVRVRDPDNPARRDFPGIEHYPVDPKWRIVAKLEPYAPHKPIDLGYEAGSTQHYSSPGAAVFELDGVSYRVDPVLDDDRPRLYLVFWDKTAVDTTYGAGRFLYAPLPEDDHVLLDFNLAFSPPCAFTPYAACPLAPEQNRLAVRVEAGEKRPH